MLFRSSGEMFATDAAPIEIGRFLESKIGEMIDRKLSAINMQIDELGSIDIAPEFDVEAAVTRSGDPQTIMNEWFIYEGRSVPSDYGVVFFRGWETFSIEERAAALRDAKRMLDRSLDR